MHIPFQRAFCCLLIITRTAQATACTKRVSASLTKGAVDAMMSFYDASSGLWDSNAPWWQSALALQALLDYMEVTGSRDYIPEARYVIQTQRRVLPWWPDGGGEFRSESTDDTGWWALALISMYDLTGEAEFLDIVRLDETYMWAYWTSDGSSSSCGGGIIWQIPTRSYHNAISNELYLTLAAKLHNHIPGDAIYLDRALQEWGWFRNSGMINAEGLINDGLMQDANAVCVNNNAPTWTYNQGMILGGLVELYKATGDSAHLSAARNIADAVVRSLDLMPGGILTEPCTATLDCEPDRTAFKGIFMRQLAKLDVVLADRPYRTLIQQNAQTVYGIARNATDFYGSIWQGPFDGASIGRQVSAVNLLIAALEV